jgi:hypothetical protein
MSETFALRLCTFEVMTPVGKQRRLGAFVDGCIADLNFATAWYMKQTGETEPQRMADALVPADLPTFAKFGLRAVHTAEELFLGAGPWPAHWWTEGDDVRGPNDEKLIYRADEVRVLAPLPELASPEAEVAGATWCPKLAAVAGCGKVPVLGFVLVNDFEGGRAMGPFIAAPHAVQKPEVVASVNGRECYRFRPDSGPPVTDGSAPGKVLEWAAGNELQVHAGDVVEVMADGLGVLRNQVAA